MPHNIPFNAKLFPELSFFLDYMKLCYCEECALFLGGKLRLPMIHGHWTNSITETVIEDFAKSIADPSLFDSNSKSIDNIDSVLDKTYLSLCDEHAKLFQELINIANEV